MDNLPNNASEQLKKAVDFHGHICPGLMIGYRAAKAGLARLEGQRSEDEELIAIVENDSCSVDGIQSLTGATFGKGNLFYKDHGKQVFTLATRANKKGVRLSFRGDRLKSKMAEGQTDRNAFIEILNSAPDEDIFDITDVDIELPDTASIHKSIPCENCGEPTMDTRLMQVGGKKLCLDCLLKTNPEVSMPGIANFLFETGMLKKTPRTGYQFLGNGSESVAEHVFRTTVLGFIMAGMTPDADRDKVVNMCLFHDLPEARTGDHNYVNKQYVTVDEDRAGADAAANVPCGPEIQALLAEFNARETLESKLANDADQLDLVVELKQKHDLGNQYASEWMGFAEKRIQTEIGLSIFKAISETDSAEWWFDRSQEHLWVKNK